MPKLIFILLLSPQQSETVAVITEPDRPAILMSKSDAEALYTMLKGGSDARTFRALTVALGKLPEPQIPKLTSTHHERERERWQRKPMGKVE